MSSSSSSSSSGSVSDLDSVESGFSFGQDKPTSDQYVIATATSRVRGRRKISNTAQDEDIRRERVLVWFHRWAQPSYQVMKQHVRVTPGLGITEEDVDLLPWSKTNATYHV